MTFEFDDAFDEFEDDIQAVVDHIRLLNNDNKIDEVISYILSLPDSVRNNNVVLGCLSSSYLIKGEYEKAEKALLQIDMNDPDFNKGGIYSYTLASIKAGEGKYVEALREGKRALMQNPTSEGLIERIFSLIADISEKLVEAGKKGLPYSLSMVQRRGKPAALARPATWFTRNSAISLGYTPHTPVPFSCTDIMMATASCWVLWNTSCRMFTTKSMVV